MKNVMTGICLVTILICLVTLYTISDLKESLKLAQENSHEYKKDLINAAKDLNEIAASQELKDILITCKDFSQGKSSGLAEETAVQLMAASCEGARAINKAALAFLVTSKSLADAVESKATMLAITIVVAVALVVFLPIVLLIAVIMLALRKRRIEIVVSKSVA